MGTFPSSVAYVFGLGLAANFTKPCTNHYVGNGDLIFQILPTILMDVLGSKVRTFRPVHVVVA